MTNDNVDQHYKQICELAVQINEICAAKPLLEVFFALCIILKKLAYLGRVTEDELLLDFKKTMSGMPKYTEGSSQ